MSKERYLYKPNHPNASSAGTIKEDRLKAAEALGKPLPKGSEVHHVNLTGELVICQDHAYHMLLHQRERALKACGNANYRKCWCCKQYDDPANMTEIKHKDGSSKIFQHDRCRSNYDRKRWKKLQEGSTSDALSKKT